MRLINRSKHSPLGRQACDAALAKHVERYGDYGRSQMKETYTVQIEGVKVWVEVVNRKASYVATAMTGMRRLRALPRAGRLITNYQSTTARMLILGMSPERFIWRRSFLMKSGWLKRL